MVERNPNFLSGQKEISAYCARPWEVVQRWIENRGFPAVKLSGRWISFKSRIDEWFADQIQKKEL